MAFASARRARTRELEAFGVRAREEGFRSERLLHELDDRFWRPSHAVVIGFVETIACLVEPSGREEVKPVTGPRDHVGLHVGTVHDPTWSVREPLCSWLL